MPFDGSRPARTNVRWTLETAVALAVARMSASGRECEFADPGSWPFDCSMLPLPAIRHIADVEPDLPQCRKWPINCRLPKQPERRFVGHCGLWSLKASTAGMG